MSEIPREQREMIARLIQREGGSKLHKVPGDSGGWTRYGIAQNKNPGIDVTTLTYAEAERFYAERYFKKARIALIPDPRLQEQVFDFAVNAGEHRAITLLQHILGVPKTGFIGKLTIAAIEQGDVVAINNRLVDERVEFYKRLAKHPARAKFLRGWLRRAESFRIPADGTDSKA